MNSLSRRLRKLEALRGASEAALPPLIYNVVDAKAESGSYYLIAGKRYGELRQATDVEVAELRRSYLLRS